MQSPAVGGRGVPLAATAIIVSAGCQVVRDTPLDNLRAMHDFARNR